MSSTAAVQRYYRFHSRIYDLTRWTFLFGRNALVRQIAAYHPHKVIEIGCGTGVNLKKLMTLLPDTTFTGFDVSDDMIVIAKRKLAGFLEKNRLILKAEPFTAAGVPTQVDLVFASYCLSMINPGFESVISDAYDVLEPGGIFAFADFHASRSTIFRSWMGFNHVRMEGHLVEVARKHFKEIRCSIAPAYGGLWHYVIWIGRK
jgi:S-adenosylmethionine-diacylgycerolhomoserine-N-methlytransferase